MPRVKRKYDNTPPTLGEGPPTLKRFGVSETGPSIPKDKDHKKITSAVVKEIGLLGDETFEEIKDYRTRFDLRDGIVSYITENDVAKLVERYLTSILDAMGLLDTVGVYSEVGTFKLRPDLWIITVRSIPVGVVEVKEPDKRGQKFLALEHPNVLGELYDFMKHLPNFYGTFPAFGILTNMNSWRFAWFPDEETNMLAAASEELEYPEDIGQLEDTVATVEPHLLLEEDEPESDDVVAQSQDEEASRRALCVSRIFNREETGGVLTRAVASFLLKMLKVKRTPFASPFARLEERTILKFIKGNERAAWTHLILENGPQWNTIANPKKNLFAIEDLGYGAHGRVWLTCGYNGAVCVLKFALNGEKEGLDEELKVWKTVYPTIPVFREEWCGEPALRMPHFTKVPNSEYSATIALVRKTLTNDYHRSSLVHEDVSWRNVGMKLSSIKEKSAIVFDMGNVRKLKEDEDDGWIDTACKKLQINREC